MRDAVIVDAVRTPIGKKNGSLSGVHPVDLGGKVLAELGRRNNLDPALVEDVVWGTVSQVGEQSGNNGRYTVLAAGWPESVPAVTVDRQCGSSQESASMAAAKIVSGQMDVVVAGGVESMSRVPMLVSMSQGPGLPFGPEVMKRYEAAGGLVGQGVSAELIAEKWGFSRVQLEELAVRSHALAAAAIDSGAFKDQIVGIDGFDTDEGVRRGTSLETLAGLKTPFKENGRITAGTSSQISDGAAALLVMEAGTAREHGLKPIARFHSFATVGVDPIYMLTGPIPATQKVLAKAGLTIDDIGAFEVNEAFASVVAAWLKETGASRSTS